MVGMPSMLAVMAFVKKQCAREIAEGKRMWDLS